MPTLNRALFTAGCLALLAALCLAAAPAVRPQPYQAGIVIFKLNQLPSPNAGKSACGVSAVDLVLTRAGASQIKQLYPNKAKSAKAPEQTLARICEATVSRNTDILGLCAALRATGQVAYAEPRYRYEVCATTPNDSLLASQWHLAKIQATSAWDITQGDTTVTIAVIDCGVQWTHPDLAANIWVNHGEIAGNGIDDDGNGYVDDIRGWDFAGPDTAIVSPAGDNDPGPTASNNDHGTAVAGDADEVTNNTSGGAGIGWHCRVMPVKCSYDNDTRAPGGKGYIDFGYEGIVYAADNRAQIINCSWGGTGGNQYENDIIQYALGKGSLVVAAAGNDGTNNDSTGSFPANYPGVLSVAATDASDRKASFSEYGRIVGVSAPGVGIWATVYPNTYGGASWSGTSMASPVTAGTAALVKAVHPSWNPATIATHLNKTGDNIDALNPGYAGKLGTRINAYNAVTTPAQPLVKYQGSYLISDNNEDGIAQAGETVVLGVAVKNWWGDAASVSATLATTDYAVNVSTGTAGIGAMAGGDVDSVAFTLQIDISALPHNAAMVLQTNADGVVRSDTFLLQVEQAAILFVNDGDGSNTVQSYYTTAFNRIGAQYDVFDHTTSGTPDSLLLDKYPAVIWSCEWAFPSLDAADRAVLRHYANHGGKFYVSGQDVGWDLQDTSTAASHEYLLDPAGCTEFYQNYLHATYGADAPGATPWTGNLYGAASDTLGNGLVTQFTQPGRGTNQFPDTFSVRAGAVKCFSYTSNPGPTSGLRYENGAAKMVYTGFGYEAMVDTTARKEFMRRIIKWFVGDLVISHTPLLPTEDTINAYRVAALVTSTAGIDSATLFYNLDGTAPFEHRLAMARVGATDTFACAIPAQNGKTVQYYLEAFNHSGLRSCLPANAPVGCYSFYAGPDPYAPAITHTPLANTINVAGPYPVAMTATDSYGVFPDSSFIHFRINSGAEQPPVQMTAAGDSFTGLITLPALLETWDTVSYYLTAVDQSSRRNVGRTPAAGYLSFVASDSALVSSFDSPAARAIWDTVNGAFVWKTYTGASHSAPASMRQGAGNYANSADYRMALKAGNGYNLQAYADRGRWVRLYYWQRGKLGTGDSVIVEASKDNTSWTLLKYSTTFSSLASFTADTVDLTSFLAGGADDTITFRFRLKSDASSNNVGWFLDDVYLRVQSPIGVAGRPGPSLPGSVALSQNRPNPFAAGTAISYQLPADAPVVLRVYNVAGQAVRTLVNGRQTAGYYNLKWDGRDDRSRKLAGGVYIYRLETGATVITRKLVLVR